MTSSWKMQHFLLMITSWLGGMGTFLLLFQHILPDGSIPSHFTPPSYQISNSTNFLLPTVPQPDKPILLVWAWPENDNFKFDPIECKRRHGIDSCNLTDDRALYSQADAVLIYHKSIQMDLSNLPPVPRPPFQRWIWFNLESPTNTRQKPGMENLFNLTLTYRRDSDISVRYDLTVSKIPNEKIEIPKKDKLICWFVSNTVAGTGAWARMQFYEELKKYLNVSIYGNMVGARLKDEDYYPTMASCKFYLSFENSIHRDYITEKFNGPISVGTVPIVLGTTRENYEQFAPGDSFIHVNDFSSAALLAQHLLHLDEDDEAYRRYFDWRRHISTVPHYSIWNEEFILPICKACDYVAKHKEYKEAQDLFKWYFS